MTSHLQRCDRTTDRNDVIAFIKYAGFDVELAKRTDGVEELTITGFDNAGDMYLLDFTPCASHSDFQSEREKVLSRVEELVKQDTPVDFLPSSAYRKRVLETIIPQVREELRQGTDEGDA